MLATICLRRAWPPIWVAGQCAGYPPDDNAAAMNPRTMSCSLVTCESLLPGALSRKDRNLRYFCRRPAESLLTTPGALDMKAAGGR